MLQLVRDKAKGIVSWTILSLVLIGFASWGFKGFGSSKNDRVIALVDGRKVYDSEVSRVLDSVMANDNQANPEDFALKKAELRNKILEELIYKDVTVKRLQELGYNISDEIIIEYIRHIPELSLEGKFSTAKYKKLLQDLKLSESEYLSQLAAGLLMQQFINGVGYSSFTNQQDINDYLRRHEQMRDFGFFKINLADVAAKIEITDQEIQSHYNKYQNQYVADDQYIIEHISLDISKLLQEIQVADDKVEKYYYDNLNEFVEPERWQVAHLVLKMEKGSDGDISGEIKAKAEDLHARLKLGESFAELVKKYSQDPSTVVNDGVLGWFTRNDNLPEEIFTLEKKAEFTDVVRTDFGYHIFYIQDKKDKKQLDLKDVAPMLKARLRQEQAEVQLANLSEDLKNMMFQLQPLSVIASELKLDLKVTDRFASIVEQRGILALPAVQQVLQELKTLPLDTASELVHLSDESFIAVKIKELKPGVKYSLDQVRAKIIAELKQLKASVEINKIAEQAVEQIKAGANPRQVAASLGSKWQVVRGVKRLQALAKNSQITPEILQLVFNLPNPSITKVRTVKSMLNKDGTLMVLALSEVRDGDIKAHQLDPDLIKQFTIKISSAKGVLDFMTAIFTVRDRVVVEKYS